MNSTLPDLIVRALLDQRIVQDLSNQDWDILIRQGRRSHLLAALAYRLQEGGGLVDVPEAPRHHLKSALLMVDRHVLALRWEVECIRRALSAANLPTVLLKGAAYVLAGVPNFHSRMFSAVDIIIPKLDLDRCEVELMMNGWQWTDTDTYDQVYYRKWMHEIPPLCHVKRGTVIDVHHAILPDTARTKVNTPALLAAIQPVYGHENLFVLSPVDMFLHSATHLFHEGDLEKGLRDLFDLDSLMRHYDALPGFWSQLVPKAVELGLSRPLFYALRYTSRLIASPVPVAVLENARVGCPSTPLLALMDFCYGHALRPMHSSSNTPWTRTARFLLYIRSHWIRMPLLLLLPHLLHKALKKPASSKEASLDPGKNI